MYHDLTRVGRGTAMGELMRQYWIPAALSSEVRADGEPIRLMVLGERLIAFRDTSGRVGVMDHRCPHRNASLFLGRNEEGGIRCVYHGWKFAVDGTCLDQGNLCPDDQFCDAVRAGAYPTVERAGLIWAYMGARLTTPPFPLLEVALLPEDQVVVAPVMRSCNWLQAMEGDIDTSHFGFLHAGSVRAEDLPEGHPLRNTVLERAPRYHVRDTRWGTSWRDGAAARHQLDEERGRIFVEIRRQDLRYGDTARRRKRESGLLDTKGRHLVGGTDAHDRRPRAGLEQPR